MRTCLLDLVHPMTGGSPEVGDRFHQRFHTAKFSTKTTSTLSTFEQLEVIRMGVNLLQELGGMDEETRIAINNRIRSIILEPSQKLPPSTISMSEAMSLIQKFGDCLKVLESLGLLVRWKCIEVSDRSGRKWIALWYKDIWSTLERLGAST